MEREGVKNYPKLRSVICGWSFNNFGIFPLSADNYRRIPQRESRAKKLKEFRLFTST